MTTQTAQSQLLAKAYAKRTERDQARRVEATKRAQAQTQELQRAAAEEVKRAFGVETAPSDWQVLERADVDQPKSASSTVDGLPILYVLGGDRGNRSGAQLKLQATCPRHDDEIVATRSWIYSLADLADAVDEVAADPSGALWPCQRCFDEDEVAALDEIQEDADDAALGLLEVEGLSVEEELAQVLARLVDAVIERRIQDGNLAAFEAPGETLEAQA